MAEAEKRISARGHDVSMMGVEVENDRARKLYERPGDKARWSRMSIFCANILRKRDAD